MKLMMIRWESVLTKERMATMCTEIFFIRTQYIYTVALSSYHEGDVNGGRGRIGTVNADFLGGHRWLLSSQLDLHMAKHGSNYFVTGEDK
jgi:hypothetical protein